MAWLVVATVRKVYDVDDFDVSLLEDFQDSPIGSLILDKKDLKVVKLT